MFKDYVNQSKKNRFIYYYYILLIIIYHLVTSVSYCCIIFQNNNSCQLWASKEDTLTKWTHFSLVVCIFFIHSFIRISIIFLSPSHLCEFETTATSLIAPQVKMPTGYTPIERDVKRKGTLMGSMGLPLQLNMPGIYKGVCQLTWPTLHVSDQVFF